MYAGVPVIGTPNEDDGEELLPATTTTFPADDEDAFSLEATRTGGTQNTIEPASSDDCVSATSIDRCAQEKEML
jgi:hypothetical protein